MKRLGMTWFVTKQSHGMLQRHIIRAKDLETKWTRQKVLSDLVSHHNLFVYLSDKYELIVAPSQFHTLFEYEYFDWLLSQSSNWSAMLFGNILCVLLFQSISLVSSVITFLVALSQGTRRDCIQMKYLSITGHYSQTQTHTFTPKGNLPSACFWTAGENW